MIGGGLSLDQSPPFEATGRFFLSAPLFIILAGFILLFGDVSLIRSDPIVVAIIHIFTLGVFTMVMFGAIQQMLPVLAGVVLFKGQLVAKSAHFFLFIGVLSFVGSFMFSFATWLVVLSSVSLFLAFSLVLGSSLYGLLKIDDISPTVTGLSIASIFGLTTSILGVILFSDYIGEFSSKHEPIMAMHMVFGIFGFAGILIIGVAFKIIPMFYVAPGFKKFCKGWVIMLIVIGLFLWTLLVFALPNYKWIGILELGTFFTAFATTIVLKLNKRRRPISDITVWYWRLAGGSLFIGMFILLANVIVDTDLDVFVAMFIGGGFLLSIIIGMLYKVVPFLVWFHLNAKGHFKMPTMREMLNDKMAKAQFASHVLALLFVMASFFIPILLKVGAVFFIISGTLIFLNLLNAVKVYKDLKDIDPMAEFKAQQEA